MDTMNAIIHHIFSARDICNICDVSNIECGEEDKIILLISQSVSNIEHAFNNLVEQKLVTDKTANLIKYLQQAEVDYTLLMYIQVNAAKSKGFVSYLIGVCEQLDVPYKSRFFAEAVWAHFQRSGVQCITPKKFLLNRKKDAILEEYKGVKSRNEWGQHNPFFFQTFVTTKDIKGFQKLVFFIARTWQDGAVRMLEILKQQSFVNGTTMYDAHGVFEHVVDDDTLSALILDSEIMCSVLKTKSVAEIKEEVLQFPSIIGAEMIVKELINEEDMLHVTVKDKTRPRGDSVKVSFHFVLAVCASKAHHKQAIEILLRDHKESIDKGLVQMKAHGSLEAELPTAWYAFDAKAAISNGFTTAFSLKARTDPHSRKYSDIVICAGMQISETLCPVQVQDLSAALSDNERLWLLQEQLYTTPKRFMLGYAAQFEAKQKKGVAKPTPGPQPRADGLEGGRVSSAQLHLPAWVLSALKTVSGSDVGVYSSPASLESKRCTLPKASQSRAKLYQVPACWCANSMSKGEVHIHTSNCTVVAVDDELGVVYMTCVTGAAGHKITECSKVVKVVNMHSALGEDGKVQPLQEVKGRCIHWAMLDEEDMNLLIKKVTGQHKDKKQKR